LTGGENGVAMRPMNEGNSRPKRARRRPGQFVEIDIGGGQRAFGRVLREPLFAFYGYNSPRGVGPDLAMLAGQPVAFRLMVMNHAVTRGRWPLLGAMPLTPELMASPDFFKQDAISGRLTIYNDDLAPTFERPATRAECEGLERAAVWEPEHVEDRLRDHFAARPNKWVDSLRLRG
jgi:hypothetical protein